MQRGSFAKKQKTKPTKRSFSNATTEQTTCFRTRPDRRNAGRFGRAQEDHLKVLYVGHVAPRYVDHPGRDILNQKAGFFFQEIWFNILEFSMGRAGSKEVRDFRWLRGFGFRHSAIKANPYIVFRGPITS